MTGHVARRGEASAQIELRILHGDQHVIFGLAAGLACVEHVGMRVDQPGQHGGVSKIDDLRARWDFHFSFGPDFSDALA